MSTVLITNNLSVYKKVYKIFEVSTLLVTNNLNVYVNDNGAAGYDYPWKQGTADGFNLRIFLSVVAWRKIWIQFF